LRKEIAGIHIILKVRSQPLIRVEMKRDRRSKLKKSTPVEREKVQVKASIPSTWAG
jgi:hypothetical protein